MPYKNKFLNSSGFESKERHWVETLRAANLKVRG
jgi:hypothetical protein